MNNETVKIFGTDWAAALQGIGTVIAIAISLWSLFLGRKAAINANRSADAAEKSAEAAEVSAKEAEKARKVSQAGLLAEHFQNINYLFDPASGFGREHEKVLVAKESIRMLRSLLTEENKLHNLLESLLQANDRSSEFLASIVARNSELKIEKEANQQAAIVIVNEIDQIKHKYLNIG